ncbi:dentin sialophosphoprotein-like isoform X2 [Artemia franciscana]|uniref:Uncharacterized protein n=2 Tax=Artemia franciscana TaxID=6661 RepID=A0AA88HA75_ARTSF|nr:hypothetical protein QYM36_014002 [Artemia franciscana]
MAMRNGDIILEPPDGLEQPVDLLRNPSKLKKFPNKAINRKNLKKEDPVNLDGINEDELETLLDEAIRYKTPKDAEQSSDLFRSLLKETTQESGEESPPAIFPVVNNPSSKKRRNKHSTAKEFNPTLEASRTKGGSLQNLNELDSDIAGYQCSSGLGGRRKNKRREGSGSSTPNVSARKREGGSLPCGVDRGGLEEDPTAVLRSFTESRPKPSRKKKELSKSYSVCENKMPCVFTEPTATSIDSDIRLVDMRHKAEFVSINVEDNCIADDDGTTVPWARFESPRSEDCVDARPVMFERQPSDDRQTEIMEFDYSDNEPGVEMDEKPLEELSRLQGSDEKSYGTMSIGYKKREDVDSAINFPFGRSIHRDASSQGDLDDEESSNCFYNTTAVTSCLGQADTEHYGRRSSPTFERKIEDSSISPPTSEQYHMQYSQTVGVRHAIQGSGQVQNGPRLKKRTKADPGKLIKPEFMEGYKGNMDVESLLDFIEGVNASKKNERVKNGKGKKKSDAGNNNGLSDGEQKETKKKSRAKSENSAVYIVKSNETLHRSSSLEDARRSSDVNVQAQAQDNESDMSDTPHSQLSKSTSNDSDKFKTPTGGDQSPIETDYAAFQTEFVPVVIEESEFRTVTKKSRKKRKSPSRPEKNNPNRRSNIHFDEARRPVHCANDDIALLYRNPRKRSGERRLSSSSIQSGYDSDKDSIHSLPCSSTTSRIDLKPMSTSNGSTPQASYADITRKLKGEEGDKSSKSSPKSETSSAVMISVKSKLGSSGEVSSDLSVDFASPELLKPNIESKQLETSILPIEIDFPPLGDDKSLESQLQSAVKLPEIQKEVMKVLFQVNQSVPTLEKTERNRKARHTKPDDERRSLPPVFVIENVTSAPVMNEGLTFGFEINEELLKEKFVKTNKPRKPSLSGRNKKEQEKVENMKGISVCKDVSAYYKENRNLDSSKFNFKDIVAYIEKEWDFMESKQQDRKVIYACNRVSVPK